MSEIPSEIKKAIIKDFAGSENNTGDIKAQIGLLSYKIEKLQEHLSKNHKDNVGKRSLTILISKRRRLLKYLMRKDFNSYQKLLEILGLRKA